MEKSESPQCLKGLLRPGPSRNIWDEALRRSGIDPATIQEYNIPDSVSVEEMYEAIAQAGASAGKVKS